jgi:hypothetical protein
MSFDPLSAAFDLGKVALEKFFPDPTKRAEEMRKLEEMRQAGDLAGLNAHVQLMLGQIKVNEASAAHKSLFVAGARPFVMWICAFALAYASIIEPMLRFIAAVGFDFTSEFPIIDTNITMQVLLGMLGLGTMRSYDKRNGTQTDALKAK